MLFSCFGFVILSPQCDCAQDGYETGWIGYQVCECRIPHSLDQRALHPFCFVELCERPDHDTSRQVSPKRRSDVPNIYPS